MSSYSDLATAIINKNGQGGKFSGLNTALDLRQAFKDAATQYAYQQQLTKEQGRNAGYASIINSSNINGVDPATGLTQFNQAMNNNGVLTPPQDASSLAGGGSSATPTTASFNKTVVNDPNDPNKIIATASPSTSNVSDKNEAYLNNSNLTPDRKNLIRNIANYQGDPSVLYKGNAGRVLASQVASYDPNFDASQYATRKAFIQGQWNKGDLFKSRQATENVVQHAQTFNQYQQALNNGDVTTANKILNSFKNETGNSSVNNAATFARVLAVESAKLLSPSGVLSDQQEKEAAASVPINASPQILNDAVQNVYTTAFPRINSALEKYKEVMGKYPTNAYSPEAINAIKNTSPIVYNQLAPKLGVQGFIDAGNKVNSQNNNSSNAHVGQKVGQFTITG